MIQVDYAGTLNRVNGVVNASVILQPTINSQAVGMANASALTAALTAAASGQGVVQVLTTGTYYFAKPATNTDSCIEMTGASGVTLLLGPGVVFKLADATNHYLLHWKNCTDCLLTGGTYDPNSTANTSGGAWNVAWPGHTCWFESCTRVGIVGARGVSASVGVKYMFFFNNFTSCYARDLTLNHKSDGIHLTGPGVGFYGCNIRGYTKDNMVGITTQDYDLYGVTAGNVSDVHVDGIIAESNDVEVWRAAGTSTYTLRRCSVRNVYGTMGTGASVASIIDDSSSTPILTGLPVYDMLFENVRAKCDAGVTPALYSGSAGKSVVFKNIHGGNKNTNIGAVTVTGVVQSLEVDGVTMDPDSKGTGLVFGSSANVGQCTQSNTLIKSTDTTTQLVTLAGTIGTYQLSNSQLDNGNAAINVSNALAADVIVCANNVRVSSRGYVLNLGNGTGKLVIAHLSNVSCTGAFALANAFGTNTIPMVLFAESVAHPSNFFTSAGYTIRLISSSAKMDGSFVASSPTAGDRFWNTNAAFGSGKGFYIYSDAGAWVKVA